MNAFLDNKQGQQKKKRTSDPMMLAGKYSTLTFSTFLQADVGKPTDAANEC